MLEGLALSPVMGFLLAGALYLLTRKAIQAPAIYQPAGERAPPWWMRGILVFTCTAVSFAHGTNDGQKSIGMIMLAIIGLFPATYALNPGAGGALSQLPQVMEQARPLIEQYGDDQKSSALQAVSFVQSQGNGIVRLASLETDTDGHTELGHVSRSDLAGRRAHLRDAIYRVISQLEHVQDAEGAHQAAKKDARELIKKLGATVEYAPWWVRILSAICLGVGTMIGYKRIVMTLGERLGSIHLTPAQGVAAEVVAASIIGVSGFTGLPVSTTHIVTSGIGGTMVGAGAKLQYGMISRILMAWLLTLPVTTLISAGIYYFLADPRF